MESAKKILPYLLIAIVFAVGGYFIGKGAMSNQQAALYNAAMTRAQVGGVKTESTGPTNPDPQVVRSANNLTQAKFLEANKVTDPKVIADVKKSMKAANMTVPTGANEWHTYTTDYGCTYAVNSAGDCISLGCWAPVQNTAQTRN